MVADDDAAADDGVADDPDPPVALMRFHSSEAIYFVIKGICFYSY